MIEADRPDGATDADVAPPHGTRVIRTSDATKGAREVQAFAWLAAAVDRATAIEVPSEPTEPRDEPLVVVHGRPADPEGPRARLRRDAIDNFRRAEVAHQEAIAEAHQCWSAVREREQIVVAVEAEEADAVSVLDAVRARRKAAERDLRRSRGAAEAASRLEQVTSRLLDDTRHRAERL